MTLPLARQAACTRRCARGATKLAHGTSSAHRAPAARVQPRGARRVTREAGQGAVAAAGASRARGCASRGAVLTQKRGSYKNYRKKTKRSEVARKGTNQVLVEEKRGGHQELVCVRTWPVGQAPHADCPVLP